MTTVDGPTLEPDERLAERARSGSVSAFEELVRRYQVPLLRFLRRRGPRSGEAEDVLQETFLRAFRSIDRYAPGRPFKPWLFTIAYRLAIDAGRRRPTGLSLVRDESSSQAGPAETAERTEVAERLWATVRATLDEVPFTAVWLCYAESLPPHQVAVVMGRSQVWVRTTLHRARKQLAAALHPLRPNAGVEMPVTA